MTEAGWTSKKPTAAGFYWFKYDFTYIVEIVDVDGKLEVWFHGNEMQSPITYLDGEWLGPLSPDSYQQGRVVSCAWKYDDIDDYYETACKRAYCLADGTLKDNDHKYCPYCGGLIQLAQQAQGGCDEQNLRR